ncbi:hypothetical protein F4678DRAFT_485352 [Xylaria arbuscula]|nr:hypothetical protein F4678DRAFT_485352 [Xylaria arbuscula]
MQKVAAKLAPKIIASGTSSPRDPTQREIAKISKSLYIIDLVAMLFLRSPLPGTRRRIHGDDIIYIMWKGIKKLAPLILSGKMDTWNYDLSNIPRQVGYIESSVLRPPSEDIYRWFTLKHTWENQHLFNRKVVVLNSDVIWKYDADVDDASARAWLWNLGHWCPHGWDNHPTFAAGMQWYRGLGKGSIPYFWDLDRLQESTGGGLPSLEQLLSVVGDRDVEMYTTSFNMHFFTWPFLTP